MGVVQKNGGQKEGRVNTSLGSWVRGIKKRNCLGGNGDYL